MLIHPGGNDRASGSPPSGEVAAGRYAGIAPSFVAVGAKGYLIVAATSPDIAANCGPQLDQS